MDVAAMVVDPVVVVDVAAVDDVAIVSKRVLRSKLGDFLPRLLIKLRVAWFSSALLTCAGLA